MWNVNMCIIGKNLQTWCKLDNKKSELMKLISNKLTNPKAKELKKIVNTWFYEN